MTRPDTTAGFGTAYADEQVRRSRHPLRRWVKGLYLRNLLADLSGPTIDFGCGAGQLLRRLPAGSTGLELNPRLVQVLRAEGLDVRQASGDAGDFELRGLEPGRYDSLVIAHVLEHLDDPAGALAQLLAACRRLGVQRVVVVVPGAKGFASDATHRTFIDHAFVETRLPPCCEGFERTRLAYFPGPWAWIGRWFVYHELKLVYRRTPDTR